MAIHHLPEAIRRNLRMISLRMPKQSNVVPQTRKADGFVKANIKNVFAYVVETACDKNEWILDYTINPGNQHDSRTFKGLYDKIKEIGIETLLADAGYKTPAKMIKRTMYGRCRKRLLEAKIRYVGK